MSSRSEINVAAGMIVFCLFNFFYLIPSQVTAEGSSPVYPMLINGVLLIFAVAYLVEGILQFKKEPQKSKGQSLKAMWRNHWRPWSLLIAMAVWIILLDFAGFLPSTIGFLFFSSYVFGAKSLKRVAALSIILPVFVFSLFHWVNAPLPAGPVEDLILLMLR